MATTAKLERAVIAGLAAYALAVQVLLACVANGAALAHALDGRPLICNSAGVGMVPDASPDGAPRDLCCVVQAIAAAPPPVPPVAALPAGRVRLPAVVLAEGQRTAAAVVVQRARAPPVFVRV